MSDSGPSARSAKARSLLVLRHEASEHLGYFEEVLKDQKISIVYSDLGDVLDLGLHDGVIVMGGPQSANNPDMTAELYFIQQVLDTETPILGICLGAQLIAKALGSHVYRNSEKEIGWAPVYLTDAGKGDPVFGGLPSPSTFFHWHSETFLLPPRAVSLAYSDKCREQVFRFRDTAYGIQFHPEVTPKMSKDWLAHAVKCGEIVAMDEPLDPDAADSGPLARQILEGWLHTF